MKESFNPGDKVEFIDDNHEGIIISIIDQNRVLVSLEDGLDIPVNKDQLIRISKSSRDSKNIPDKYAGLESTNKKVKKPAIENNHIYLAVTVGAEESGTKVYLLNESSWILYYTVFSENGDQMTGISHGKIDAEDKQLISHFSQLDKGTELNFHILRYAESGTQELKALSYQLNIDPKLLVKDSHFVEQLDKRCIIQSIYTSKPKKEKLTLAGSAEKKDKAVVDKPKDVVDLHIEKIAPNHALMSRNEIFDYQFNHFVTSVEKAIAFNYDKIIFIHGIGVQSLKNKITAFLDHDKNVKEYRDANVREYGYGATEVILNADKVFNI